MNAKAMTVNGWKPLALKFKIEDNGLQKALAEYEKLKRNDHQERLEAIAEIKRLADTLKKDNEVAKLRDVVKHLAEVQQAAEAHRKQIEAEAVAAAKAAAEAK